MNKYLIRYNVPCLISKMFFVQANNQEEALNKSIKVIEQQEDVCFKRFFEIISMNELENIPCY